MCSFLLNIDNFNLSHHNFFQIFMLLLYSSPTFSSFDFIFFLTLHSRSTSLVYSLLHSLSSFSSQLVHFSCILLTCTESLVFRPSLFLWSPSLHLSLSFPHPPWCSISCQWLQKPASELRGVKHFDKHCCGNVMCCLFVCLTHLATRHKAAWVCPSGL